MPTESQPQKPKIVYMLTSPVSLRLVRGQLEHFAAAGFEVEVICGDDVPVPKQEEGRTSVRTVRLDRQMNPLTDALSVVRVAKLLKQSAPDIVNLSTPKAALIGSVAASLVGIPKRIYVMRGFRFETERGVKQTVLKYAEKWICRRSDRVVCVSHSLRARAVKLGVTTKEKSIVIGSGSSNGVECQVFAGNYNDDESVIELRRRLGIPELAPVIGFVGRFTRDKGLAELLGAFRTLQSKLPTLRLLMVGDFEAGDSISPKLRREIECDPHIVSTGFIAEPQRYYQLMDVLALPTHREGFPNVALEAQAASVPVVTTDATGACDSVIPGETGIVTRVGDSTGLADALEELLKNPEMRLQMGQAGARWVAKEFRPIRIWQGLEAEYRSLLLSRTKQKGWQRYAKSTFDRFAAAVGLIVLSPAIAFVAAAVALGIGKPVLFRQRRPGFKGRNFMLLKFRTMRDLRNESGELLKDDVRLTRLGRFIRSCSLDELPQLWNVLRGDLSLVGPRPLLMQYLDRYSPTQARRHEVMPGITGWAQINGRNALTWEEKFDLDVWYVDNWSLGLDLQILCSTFVQVLKRKDISQPGHATSEEFLGTSTSVEDSVCPIENNFRF